MALDQQLHCSSKPVVSLLSSSLTDLSEEEQQHFEDLLKQKIQVVNERDALVIQTDEERKRWASLTHNIISCDQV